MRWRNGKERGDEEKQDRWIGVTGAGQSGQGVCVGLGGPSPRCPVFDQGGKGLHLEACLPLAWTLRVDSGGLR